MNRSNINLFHSEEKTPVSTYCLKVMADSLQIAEPQIFNITMLLSS